MTNSIDKNLREYLQEYFKPILDIKYVIGQDIGKTAVKDLSKIKTTKGLKQLEALAQLYYVSESMVVEGKSPYLIIDVDKDGNKYAEITPNYIDFARQGGFTNKKTCSIASGRFTKFYLKNMDEISDETVGENLLEDTIDDKINYQLCERADDYFSATILPSKNLDAAKAHKMMFIPFNKKFKKSVSNFSDVTEIPSEYLAGVKKYKMIFRPSDKKLQDEELRSDRSPIVVNGKTYVPKGDVVIVNTQTDEPIEKLHEFKLFSN